MNKNWRNRPTSIEEVPNSIDWVIGIDESGTPNLENIDANNKYFAVTACLMQTNNIPTTENSIMMIKNQYWKNGLYLHRTNREKRVCFHSTEIRRKKYAFDFKDERIYNEFLADLTNFLSGTEITLISSFIDKQKLLEKYATPYNPYDLCLEFILERVIHQIENNTCVLVLESRGKNEDMSLLKHIISIIDNGTNYVNSQLFKNIKGVYFNPKWSKNSDDKKSYWILECADLYGYSIFKHHSSEQSYKPFEITRKKLRGYPYHVGTGLKIFP